MTYRLALFDMDDVLYAYRREIRVDVVAKACGLDPAFVERRIFEEGVEDDGDTGLLGSTRAYLDAWSGALDRDITLELWTRARARAMTPIPGSIALMRVLAAEGVTVAVLTNNGFAVKQTRAALAPAVALLTGDRFLVSAEFGSRKPSPVVYERALARLGFSAAETVFVDDRPENVDGARAAGITALPFETPDRLVSDLAGLGLGAAARALAPAL